MKDERWPQSPAIQSSRVGETGFVPSDDVSIPASGGDPELPLPGVVCGSRNPEKVRELAAMLAGLARLLPPPQDISPENDEVEEEGESVEANAAAKAVAWSRRLLRVPGGLVVASDGGLLVPALGTGWDPTRTRRFAGAGAGSTGRADALLALTDHLEGEERRIGWREAVAFARDGRVVASFVAESVAGLLARDYDPGRVGEEGFWLPALWICPEWGGRRLADLSAEERAAREDHWSRIRREVREWWRLERRADR